MLTNSYNEIEFELDETSKIAVVSEKINVNNQTITNKQQSTSSTVVSVSGGGATVTKADGTVVYLPDDPNERQKSVAQTLRDFQTEDQSDSELRDIANSGPLVEGQDF